MSHPLSGSEKLKEKCQSMASLTPEEITQVAGGFSFGGFNLLPGGSAVFQQTFINQGCSSCKSMK